MDDGNWAADMEEEQKQYNIAHIEYIRHELALLRDARLEDNQLFIKLTHCIGSLEGLKNNL